jgi:hypothetical protein
MRTSLPNGGEAIMWFKDAAAGVSLVVFLASSYLLVPIAQSLMAAYL